MQEVQREVLMAVVPVCELAPSADQVLKDSRTEEARRPGGSTAGPMDDNQIRFLIPWSCSAVVKPFLSSSFPNLGV